MAQFNHTPLDTPLPELEATTTEQGRTYETPDGQHYPSITTVLHILSEAPIAAWRKRIGEDTADAISKHACDRGTALHAALEAFLKNQDISWIDPVSRILLNRARFTLRRITNIVAQEVALWSDELRVAGRCDCIADFDGVPTIVDFKTADRIKKEEWIAAYYQQATGYSLMWQERTGRIVEQLAILIVGEDGSCKTFIEQRGNHIAKLRTTVSLYQRQQP